MIRILVVLFACLVVVANLFGAGAAQAQPLLQFSFPGLNQIELTPEQRAAVNQLEDEIIPQIESLLRPDQLDDFKAQLDEGKSFRKAFKSLTLTPEQKTALASLIKSLPKSDAFATLTSDQKRAYFLSRKSLFKPTAEEIVAKIKAGGKEEGGMPSLEEITEKIKAGMKAKETYAPSAEVISEKIKAGMKAKGSFAPSAEEIGEKINAGMKRKEMYMPNLDEIGSKIGEKMKALTESD
ncbi:MAG: hypothetical protein ACKO7W_16895 [Elainella sp.]